MPGFRSILQRADAHFARVMAKQPDALACRRGCSLCCHGLFEISAADISVLADGLASLPPAVREEIVQRAEAMSIALEIPVIQELTPEEKEAFFVSADNVPCPALGVGGACLVYVDDPGNYSCVPEEWSGSCSRGDVTACAEVPASPF